MWRELPSPQGAGSLGARLFGLALFITAFFCEDLLSRQISQPKNSEEILFLKAKKKFTLCSVIFCGADFCLVSLENVASCQRHHLQTSSEVSPEFTLTPSPSRGGVLDGRTPPPRFLGDERLFIWTSWWRGQGQTTGGHFVNEG